MNITSQQDKEQPVTSVLALLRRLSPARALSVREALRIAELQATRLRELAALDSTAAPASLIGDQSRIMVEHDPFMPDGISGASDWNYAQRCWLITINGQQPRTRQRFTLFHEYKHIVDHGRPAIHDGGRRHYGLPANEYVADYFAGCVLMPRPVLKRAWASGTERTDQLAKLFDVSERAIEVRLTQIGLTGRGGRCGSDQNRQQTGAAA